MSAQLQNKAPVPQGSTRNEGAVDKPAAGGASPSRAAARGMSFEEGEAAFAPVQLKKEGATPAPPSNAAAKGADAKAPGAAELAPGADAKAGAEGGDEVMSPRDVLDAWDINRTQGMSVEWMSALQGFLGVPATGISSKELVRALARLQVSNGQDKHLGQLVRPVRTFLKGQFAGLGEIAEQSEAGETTGANVAANAQAPENEAVRRLQLAPSYGAYVGGFKTMSFLGQPVVGHPEFLGRVNNAEKYLAGKFPGKSAPEIGQAMGVNRLSHFRTSKPGSDQMYHGLGFALDVNPPQNNWHFGSAGRAVKMSDVMKHVGDLFGETMVRSARDMAKNAKEGTTEELFAKLEASNEALKNYRKFANDKASLEAHLASDKAPSAAKGKGANGWASMIAQDEKWLAKHMKGGEGDEGPAGFMDYKKELVVALRDAGGLRWGGADLGGDNGDLMHFDGGTMDLAKRIRNTTRTVRTQQAAAGG